MNDNVSPKVFAEFRDKINETLAKCQKFSKQTLPVPKLIFGQLGVKAGCAQYRSFTGEAHVKINSDFLKNHYDDMLNDTLPHEVAHVVTGFLFPMDRGHGKWWKMVMGWIGLPAADRCHTYSLEGVKNKKHKRPYQYSCKCEKPHFCTERIHRAIQCDNSWRKCKRCRTRIEFAGKVVGGVLRPAIKKETPSPLTMVVTTLDKGVLTKLATPLNFVETIVPEVKVTITPEPTPAPSVEPRYKLVGRFLNGTFQNVKVLDLSPA